MAKMKFTITFAVCFLLSVVLSGYLHEQAHVEIFRINGITSHVEYFSHFPSMATIGDEPCDTASCIISQSNVEAIGYQLTPILVILGIGLLFIIGLMEYRVLLEEELICEN